MTSLYSSNVVNLTPFPNLDKGLISPSVPNGWTYLGTSCFTESSGGGRAFSEIAGAGSIDFISYTCTVYVSRTNPGWWLTSFFLFSGILFIAFFGSIGVMSHGIAEARDDRDSARRALFDGTRLIGTYTIGLLLTYVFQVEISPYGQPVEFWPRVPTSTMIYVLGMTAIFVQSMVGLIGSLVFQKPLLSEGFVGKLTRPYDLDQCPKEGEVGEDRGPLILKKYSPKANEDLLEGPPVEAEPEESPPKIAKFRKNNQKSYNVLSVEEARQINTFVRNIFFLKVFLLVASFFIAMVILVVAKSQYQDLVDSVVKSVD